MATKTAEGKNLCSVWFCKNEGVHYHHRGGCGVMFCDEHEAQSKNPNIPIVELEGN